MSSGKQITREVQSKKKCRRKRSSKNFALKRHTRLQKLLQTSRAIRKIAKDRQTPPSH